MYRDLIKRIMALALSVCMVAGMVDLSGLTVRAEEAEEAEEDYTIRDARSGGDIEIDDADLVYDGTPKEPGVTIEGVSQSDYTVTYYRNTDATIQGINQPYVTITNKNDGRDTVDVEFTIQPRDISDENDKDFTVEPSNLDKEVVDFSKPVTPEVVLKYKGVEADYRRIYTNNTGPTSDDRKASVQLEGRNNFIGTRTIEFAITLLDPDKLTFEFADNLDGGTWNYDSKTSTEGAKPDITNVKYNGKALPEGSKYEPCYANNTGAGTAKVWVEITDGPYKDLSNKDAESARTFTIVKWMNRESYKDKNIYLKKTIPKQPYACDNQGNMQLKEEDLVFVDPDYPNDTLKLGEDYDYVITSCKVKDYNPDTGKGTGEVTVTGTGKKYTKSRTETFEIEAPSLTEQLVDKASIPDCTYDVIDSNGTEKRWYDVVAQQLKLKIGDVECSPVTDYTVEPLDERNKEDYGTSAGWHTLKLTSTGKGKLKAGTPVYVKYEVKKRTLSEVRIEMLNYTDYVYDGTEKCPEVQLTYISRDTPGGRKTLDLKEYMPRYRNNTNATEEAEVYAEGIGDNFTGKTSSVYFKILPIDLTDSEFVEVTGFEENQFYTGNQIKPFMNVLYKLKDDKPPTLLTGSDYTVSYKNNINVGEEGEAEVTIIGKGNYSGNYTINFTIKPRDLNDEKVVSVDSLKPLEYTGEELRPAVTVRHSTKKEPLVSGDENNENSGDYYVRYSDNVDVGTATVTITGRGNYTGTLTKNFDIDKRNLKKGTFKISHKGTGEVLIPEGEDEHYHRYTGDEIVEGFDIEFSFLDGEGNKITNTLIWDEKGDGNGDYTLTFDNHQDVGTALVTIVPNEDGNYKETYTIRFRIKGNLSDSNAEVTIPEQTYTSKKIVPANAEVTFETISGVKKLLPDVDYEMECDNNISAGTNARATIRGKDNYYDVKTVTFTILPFNLSEPDPENNEYVIDMAKEYTFCDTNVPIQPVPVIKHNGNLLTEDDNGDYYIVYGPESVNSNVGTGSLTVKSTSRNYIGEREVTFDILPYDIEAGEAEEEPHITIEGIEDVILDELLDNPEENAAAKIEDGKVVMSDLRVMYTPVDWNGKEYETRALVKDEEYTVTYDGNDKIGTATITIEGKEGGNFTGTITKTFRIRGDLSSERTQVSVEDCIYNPTGNKPEPSVVYTYSIPGSEDSEEITMPLTAGIDYKVDYDNYTDSTVKSGAPAKVIITPVCEEGAPAVVKGDFAQSEETPRSAEFVIEQRDLAKAIETEENEKDPLLEVTGLVEDGYEYTGSDIVPELRITCAKEALVLAGEDNSGDYKISADNNLDVYTFEKDEDGKFIENENGERNRLKPIVTVEAVKDGNYKGKFTLEFKINPREISAATIASVLHVDGEGYNDSRIPEVDYNNGEAIMFPLESDLSKNDIDVTWNKQGQSVNLEEDRDYLVSYDKNWRIGEAVIIISGKEFSNYRGKYMRTFKIMASIEEVDKEEPQYMTLEDYEDVPYGIVAVYPKLKFIDVSGGSEDKEAYILEEGKDFEIVTTANQGTSENVSRNNINVADKDAEEPPTVVIRGIGCYRGEIERTYSIIPKDLTEDDIEAVFAGTYPSEEYENAYVYTGDEIKPAIEVTNNKQPMKSGVDYTIDFDKDYANNKDVSTDKLKASVTIHAVDGSNYVGQKTFEFNIIPRQIDGMQVELVGDNPVYNRKAKTPDVEVYYKNGTEKVVLKKSDYDVAYENNTNAANEKATNAPVVTVTGKGSYTGTLTKTFTIEPEKLDESNDDFNITAASVTYTGKEVTTTLVVKAKDGTLLINKADVPETPEVTVTPDYEVVGYKDNVNVGTGSVTIRGLGNYTGSRRVPFQITPLDISADLRVGEIPDQEYTSKPVKPQVNASLAVGDFEVPLTNFEVEYVNNTNVGTATAVIKGGGNYIGEKRVNFKITPKSIGTVDGIDQDMVLSAIEDQLYTGRGVTPDVSLRFRRQAAGGRDGIDELLVSGKDYTLSYLTNVPVGTASVNIIGIGNYTGNIQTQFRILGPMNLADVAKINAQPYTGSAVTPEPNVSYAGKKLTKGEDYTLVYEDNVTQGTAKITITGQGMYTGEKIVTFEIARDFSNETIVKGMAAAYTYTGKAITPVVLVEDHGRILSRGTDFKVSYSNNVNVGTATVTVTGMGAYSGTASAQFKITPQNIGRAAVSKVADQTYDGKDKKPSVSVSSDGIALKSGTDYTVVHVDNKNPGKASVVIKGKGNFTGTQTINYNIIVPKVTGVKASGYTDTTITFSWKRNKVVTGYEIYNSKNKRVARVKKNSIVEATVSKLKAGSTETFRVRAYVTRGQYYYSDFVSIKAGTAPKATSITGITSSKSKQVELKWKKVTGATQYQVYRSTSKDGKYKKIATTKKTSYTDKKATGGKTYYYKIRVGKKNGSKTYYIYSQVKSVAAKK